MFSNSAGVFKLMNQADPTVYSHTMINAIYHLHAIALVLNDSKPSLAAAISSFQHRHIDTSWTHKLCTTIGQSCNAPQKHTFTLAIFQVTPILAVTSRCRKRSLYHLSFLDGVSPVSEFPIAEHEVVSWRQILPNRMTRTTSPHPIQATPAAIALVGAIPIAFITGSTAADAPAEQRYLIQL